MSRLIHRLIVVSLKDDKPHTFVDDGRSRTIALIVDEWEESGAWWLDEPSHHLYTVMTTGNSLYDIERVGSEWFIYRVWD